MALKDEFKILKNKFDFLKKPVCVITRGFGNVVVNKCTGAFFLKLGRNISKDEQNSALSDGDVWNFLHKIAPKAALDSMDAKYRIKGEPGSGSIWLSFKNGVLCNGFGPVCGAFQFFAPGFEKLEKYLKSQGIKAHVQGENEFHQQLLNEEGAKALGLNYEKLPH